MYILLCLKCACVLYLPQRTGWSALYFSAERGDVDTTTSLLKAESNAQLRDKVCYLSFIPSLLSVLFTCLHLISIKNGLTPLEVAVVKRDEEEERQRQRSGYWYEERDYEGVIDLLSRYSKEPATLPSHDVSRFNTHVAFTILPHIVQNTPSPEQDTTSTHLSSTVDKDTLSSPTNSQVSSIIIV